MNDGQDWFVSEGEVAEELLEFVEYALAAFELFPFWWKVWILEFKVVSAGHFDACDRFDTDKGIAVFTGAVVGTFQ